MFAMFLLMLAILVFANLRHGLLALRTRENPAALANRTHRLTLVSLALVAIPVGILGYQAGVILLTVFVAISLTASVTMLRESLLPALTPQDRIKIHFDGLIGSGIGAHTAFFAFGGARYLSDVFPGQWQVVMWVLPSVSGVTAIARLKRRYSRAGDARRVPSAA